MRDEQTGTYWQQITGLAISGPLAGERLEPVYADELTFSLWKSEQRGGTVLDDVRGRVSEYAPLNWDVRMAKVPTVIGYAQAGLKPRDLMLGIQAFGASRAFPYARVLKEKLVQDRVGSEPILLVVGSDNSSVRAFKQRLPGESAVPQFYRISEHPQGALSALTMMDSTSGSRWSFQGCAIGGKLKGVCLEPVEAFKDYWFDWRNYHPETTVYGIRQKIR